MIISLAIVGFRMLAAARQHGVGAVLRANIRRAQPGHDQRRDRCQRQPARNRAIANWRRDAATGRLECRWVFDEQSQAGPR